MKQSTKVILAVVLGIAGLCLIACCGLGYLGYASAKTAMDPQFLDEIKVFAADADEYQCEKEAIRRMESCSVMGFGCKVKASVFNSGCLAMAKPAEGFCDRFTVDPDANIMEQSFQMGLWSGEVCKGSPDPQTCQNVMQASGKHCLGLPGS